MIESVDNFSDLALRAAAQQGGLHDWPSIFCDWFTASEFHPEKRFPALVSGVAAQFDGQGNCRFERAIPARHTGSFETSVGIYCDGHRVGLSGNVGRFGRADNLFNLGWGATRKKADRILSAFSLPALQSRPAEVRPAHDGAPDLRGGTLARVDLTCNFSAGSDAQARRVIQWLAGQSLKRAKRGYSGDQSVWWSNTRMMLKAYRKGPEMKARGGDAELIEWANDCGIVRVEVELKRRELQERGLREIGEVTQDKLEAVFHECIEPFRRVDSSDEPDILAAIPSRSRAYAAAWLAGQDIRLLCSQATLYRHARVLRDYGLDVLEPRNIERFPVKVRVIDLAPVSVPDWYLKRVAA